MRPGSAVAEVATCPADRHGTHHAHYQLECICPSGKDAAFRYSKARRTGHHVPRLRSAVGTRRRVQAMAVVGRTGEEIAHVVGCDRRHLRKLLTAGQVTVEIERAVRAAEWMAWQPAPPSLGATFARRNAERQRWWPIDAWFDVDTDPEPTTVDEITVMHAAAGDYTWRRLGEQDRRGVVGALVGRGLSDTAIAEKLRTTNPTIGRTRQRLGLAANPHDSRRWA